MKSQFTGAVALFSLISGAASANTLTIDYFTAPETGAPDFGICCSSAPSATLPVIAPNSSLLGGLPVTTTGGTYDVKMVSGTGQILWWTPSNKTGIQSDGTGIVTLPFGTGTNNMYSPHGTGSNDNSSFQTAILSGTIFGTSKDVTLTVSSDDDALVYVNGKYVGGNPGVHPTETAILDLGMLSGANSLEIFYADRAHTGAELDVSLSGANVSAVPEPSTWAMMILGFFGLGFVAYRRKSNGIQFRLA